ncbi:hypothetical protein [Salipiger mangrovisoli]|uniref:DUF2946 domain-containing protein n=1 Tax=Salipiger mangrovisoli TaxID=2865933 RepID=A0ABR9X6U2_9RHOB|nr:hypothetical protein [Salipiger mangrovisoli]MBE9639291.1 hypothetical protein [Salipiger mangrovisoli]
MIRARAQRLSLCVVILVVALASVVFAARMAPDEVSGARLEGYLAMGGTLADLCAEEGPHHGHHCPVCNLLPETPESRLPIATTRLDSRFHLGGQGDLGLPPQRGHMRGAPRAPPALA